MIDQLIHFYYSYDKQEVYLDEKRARQVFQILLDRGRLHLHTDLGGNLLGYGESLRISFEQLGRIVCREDFYANLENEDIEHGSIAYLVSVTIHPGWRLGHVFKILRNDYFTKNHDAEYFIGHSMKKKHSPWKIFTRNEAYRKWINPVMEGV